MDFQTSVYRTLASIPRGKVMTYGSLARAIGRPGAARAVGQTLHRNPNLVRIPCHRVVRADGRIGGYVGGISKKVALLRREGISIRSGRIEQFKKHLFV